VLANLQPLEVVEESSPVTGETTKPKQIVSEDDDLPDYIQKLLDDVDDSIPESACMTLEEILRDNVSVFSQHEYDLGRTNIIQHYIDTGNSRPVRQSLRCFPPAHVEAISEHIKPAQSPWASNIVLAKKKDGTFRCCVDYRQSCHQKGRVSSTSSGFLPRCQCIGETVQYL